MKRFLWFIIYVTITTACYGNEFRRAKTFEDAFQASCRVSVSNARGSGTFIGEDREKNRCIILTNYHVVTSNNTAKLDFWTNGIQQTINGRVFARFYDAKRPYDFALIEVDSNELAKINPPFVALGGQGVSPDQNSYILSSGCPKGRFAQAWKGKVLGYYNGATIMFQPGPVPGQSGSGVLSEVDGELWLTGVLTWLIGNEGADDSKGGAIPIANLYEALKGQQNASTNDNGSPIPPGAVECAEKMPYVVEFSRNNCQPCILAEKDVAVLKQKNIDVRSYNTSLSDDAIKKAKEANVTSAPTFIVYDENGVEKKRYLGAGHANKISSDIEELTKILTAKRIAEEIERTKANQAKEDKSLLELTDDFLPLNFNDLPCYIQDKPSNNGEAYEQSFRDRSPVYEYELDNSGQVGFFDDSNSRWMNRNRREEPERNNVLPPRDKDDEPKIDEGKLGDRLGDRLGNRLQNGLSDSVNRQLNAIISVIEGKIEQRLNEKLETIKSDIEAQKKPLLRKAILFVVFAFIIGSLVADTIKSILKCIWRSIRNSIREFASALERAESVDKSDVDNLYSKANKDAKNDSIGSKRTKKRN